MARRGAGAPLQVEWEEQATAAAASSASIASQVAELLAGGELYRFVFRALSAAGGLPTTLNEIA